jgi:hypothetical protein
MKYRTVLIVTAAFVAAMFAFQWVMAAAMQRAITTGWEMPSWFRFLFVVSIFWKEILVEHHPHVAHGFDCNCLSPTRIEAGTFEASRLLNSVEPETPPEPKE